ncbi:metallophosphoesterase [Polyangium aurulentum]|uniref:metallophosphoesterase n=1 Tax=Polyangium aurulentum TaxID=2567896 RepID=UPI0010ADD5DA|nr:metallophosphoesterase [Polyangium aurulentum]UQA55492.1 metallophosphoesterase [Polyangium aurulentum]
MRRLSSVLLAAPAAALLAIAAPASAEQLVRKPYIQTLTPTSAILVWTTDSGANSVVHYGTSPQSLTQVAELASSVTQHEVKLSNLQPGTRYYYDVGSAGGGVLAGGDASHYFETAPPPGTKKKIRAWVVGDSGTGSSRQAAVRDAMLAYAGAYRPHLFLHMGDIAYTSGTTQEFTDKFFGMYPAILENTVVWPTLGNHEGQSSDSQTQTGTYYTAYVLPKAGEAGGMPSGTEAYYSFDYGNVHFVVLDSHDTSSKPGSPELVWLQSDLAATNQDWIIAYWHHPPYTKGSHNSDTEAQLVTMRENVLPILEAAGVDLVLGGHSHIYERSFLVDGAYNTPTTASGHIKDSGDGKPLGNGPYKKMAGNNSHDGAVYVVAGHGGTGVSGNGGHPLMYFTEVDNGSCILDIQGNRLGLVNIRWDGAITDRFAMVKGTGLVLAAPDGGEKLTKDQSFDIKWATVGTIPDVKLEYSADDGQSWKTIIASTPNTGTYTWTVPAVDTATAIVRVSSAANAAVQDESNAGFAIAASGPVKVIPFGDVWKYDGAGVDHGITWLEPSFDDSAWASGPAQLGYGDGDEATAMNDSPVHPSYYFRKVIALDGPVIGANLEVLHDDGVAVWINGTQVFSKYMDDGLGHNAFASQGSQDNELDAAAISLAPNPFVEGKNVVAVMVKQSGAASSDLSFDLELEVTVKSTASGGGGAGGTGGAGGAGHGGAPGASGPGAAGSCGCRMAGGAGSPLALLGLGVLALVSRRRSRIR